MKTPSLEAVKIRKLHDFLLQRKFAIPKLQRNFVWDPGRAAKLLDSIYREMPVGSLFLWEMDRKSAHLIRQSADVLPSVSSKNRYVWFVIDGQQRLSVIYQAFKGETRQNDAGRSIDFGRICFVVSPDSEDDDPPRIVYRKPIDGQLVSLQEILAPNWRKHIPAKPKFLRKRVQECRNRILNYPLPVVTVRGATLDEIGEVFIRVNSQGMRITSADRAIALMGKLDVRAMAQELRQKIRDVGFSMLTVDPILMGFNLVTEIPQEGDPPKLEAMARRWSKLIERSEAERAKFRKVWHRYQHAFLSAVDYMRNRFPVHDESYLPSGNMLATLSVFFYHHKGPPSAFQARELRKWFWATGVAERYSGRGYHRNLVSDARLFEDIANGKHKLFKVQDLLDPVLDIQGAEYTNRSARTRAFFCLLSQCGPRYLENGEEIFDAHKVLSHANKRDRHHIFPKGQMAGKYSARVYNSLCNMCFLVSRDNQKIGKQLPRKYLDKYHAEGSRRFHSVMKSHLIPAAEGDGVWKKGLVTAFKQFRKERLTLICSAFESAAGIRLFRRS